MVSNSNIKIGKIGIIGGGNLGHDTWKTFAINNNVKVYDIIPERSSPPGTMFEDMLDCWAIIICISLQINQDGDIDTDPIVDIIGRLHKSDVKRIIIRTKIPPGTCDSMDVYYLPDLKMCKENKWILGIPKHNHNTELEEWCKGCCDPYMCHAIQAEISSLVIGSYLCTKKSFFKEVEDYCLSIGVEYDNVARIVSIDDRVGSDFLNKKLQKSYIDDLFSMEFHIRKSNIPTPIMGGAVRRINAIGDHS